MFTKQYLKTRDVCKVRFKLNKALAGAAKTVRLVGEFNNWDEDDRPMTRLKSGDFTQVLELAPDRTYQFRYLLDGRQWINDDAADAYKPSPYPGVDNSVIDL